MDIRNIITGIIEWTKDHRSDLKMAIGTAGVIGGSAVMCKDMIKVSEIIKEYHEDKKGLTGLDSEKHDIRVLRAKTAGKVAVKLLPGAVMEAAGLGLMWNGYSDVKAAFVGVSAAYTGLQEFTERYRNGVREKYGEEEDERLAYQFREEEITVKDEDGHEETKTVRIYPQDSRKLSPYARYFCYGEAEGAEHSYEYNRRFLDCQMPLMNNYLRSRKKFMLNDCYDMLGIKRSRAGFSVGWVYDPEYPEGDNQVKLRVQTVYREKLDEYGNPNGYEKVLMIDPNVDGMVLDKMQRMGLIDE